MIRHALEGMKVVTFAEGAAGPIASKYLADFGAVVICIESEAALDYGRATGPFKDGKFGLNRSGTFELSNSSKLGMTLNLKKRQALDVAKRLVAWADVVIENRAPGVMQRLGLDYDELKKVKEDIIMLSSSVKGQTGPQSALRAWGVPAYTEAGYMEFVGWPDRPGVVMQSPIVDYEAAWYSVSAILAAWDYKQRTGKGQHIDVSQTEVGISFLAPAVLAHQANGVNPARKGNSSNRAAPYGVYRCKGADQWCAVAVFTDSQWGGLRRAIGNPEWAEDARFSTLLGRLKHREELDRLLEVWTVNLDAGEVMTRMQNEGVPAGKVQTAGDLLDADPQLKHRGFWREVNSPELGMVKHYSSPARLSKTSDEVRTAPRMGEHTRYICTNFLGMSDKEFSDGLAAGIFK